MKTQRYITLIAYPLFLAGCIGQMGSPNFEGAWECKDGSNETMTINKVSKKTYELDFGEGVSFSGEVNDNGVLVVEMMGNVSRLAIDGKELHFSGILAPCKDFMKK